MLTLLLVDDEKHVRDAIRQMCDFPALGITRVLEAENGQDALRLILRERPQIVITDMKMPLVSGAQMLRMARDAGFSGQVIVLSGFKDFEYTREGIRTGALDYLLKPINRGELNDTLKKAVESVSGIAQQPSFLDEMKTYVDAHYAEEISLELFAKKYFLSKEYILRRFKEKYGIGVYEYVMTVRMNEARRRLLETDLQIQEIAYQVGFNDSHYFSKVFRNRFGMTPKEARKPGGDRP